MFINAKVELGSRELPAIAESAVVTHQSKRYVFIQTGERRFKITEVQTGEVEQGKISLLNNNIDWLAQKVVTRNAFTLLGAMFNNSEEE
jgi:NMD protein affecting ribosome stability and mRNA decay